MKNSQKGFVLPLLIAVIALSVLGGTYTYMYVNQPSNTQVVATTNDSPANTDVTLESPTLFLSVSSGAVLPGSMTTLVINKTNSVNPNGPLQELRIGDTFSVLPGVVNGYEARLTGTCNLDVPGAKAGEKYTCDVAYVPLTIPDSETPSIESITPNTAKTGATLEISGRGLAGFEGDVYFFFKRTDNKITMLPGVITTQTTGATKGIRTAQVVLKEPCQQGETVYGDYSGIPAQCDYVQLTPGVYKVYTTPWGKKSNEVQFTVL